uniref:Uncharacterized protein n=1 Tax=Glossina austeni TaxID=7395 RepID=A0A1A9VT19_GLOAU
NDNDNDNDNRERVTIRFSKLFSKLNYLSWLIRNERGATEQKKIEITMLYGLIHVHELICDFKIKIYLIFLLSTIYYYAHDDRYLHLRLFSTKQYA